MKIGPSERGYIGRHVSIIITFHYQMETGARASADRSNTHFDSRVCRRRRIFRGFCNPSAFTDVSKHLLALNGCQDPAWKWYLTLISRPDT